MSRPEKPFRTWIPPVPIPVDLPRVRWANVAAAISRDTREPSVVLGLLYRGQPLPLGLSLGDAKSLAAALADVIEKLEARFLRPENN